MGLQNANLGVSGKVWENYGMTLLISFFIFAKFEVGAHHTRDREETENKSFFVPFSNKTDDKTTDWERDLGIVSVEIKRLTKGRAKREQNYRNKASQKKPHFTEIGSRVRVNM